MPKAPIILAGPNFGCGSSREAAVWAQPAPMIVLPPKTVVGLARSVADAEVPSLTVDLEACQIELPVGRQSFSYPAQRRAAFLEGLDEIEAMLRYLPEIEAFREAQRRDHPWVYHRPPHR